MENKRTKMNIQYLIDNFLFKYRTTPHSVTGVSPAEKMLKQLPRTRLTMLRKNRENRQEKQERKIKERIDKRRGKMREFEKGEQVLVLIEKNNKRATWDKGQIFKRSAFTYLVWLENAISRYAPPLPPLSRLTRHNFLQKQYCIAPRPMQSISLSPVPHSVSSRLQRH